MKPDAYRNCDDGCTHDTAKGLLVDAELLDREGPYPDSNPLLSTGPFAAGILARLRDSVEPPVQNHATR